MNLTTLNQSLWLMIYFPYFRLLNYTSWLIQSTHAIWIRRMLLLSTLVKWLSILNCIMRNSLINRFQPLRIIIMILYNFLINILLRFLLCRNSTKKLTHVLRNLYLQRLITLYILPPSPLHFLIHSLILITFFIRYLPDNTLKQCWFLVQINHVETALLDMN